MARSTRAKYQHTGADPATTTLASAKNPDGTDYTLPVSGTVTATGTIADGADVNAGATIDAAVVTDANGTLSGKLRGLVKMLADVWDSTAHILNVAVKGVATAALSNVASSATTVTLLALNASRKGAMVFNDCDKALYLKFGATASATSFTVKIAAGGYYELPGPVYTGRIDGIWEAAPTGSARITEMS